MTYVLRHEVPGKPYAYGYLEWNRAQERFEVTGLVLHATKWATADEAQQVADALAWSRGLLVVHPCSTFDAPTNPDVSLIAHDPRTQEPVTP